MELCEASVIASLLEIDKPAKRPRTRLRGQPSPHARYSARPVAQRRCACGECYQCRENARWDKIFNEKFADPEYYSRSRPFYSSSLSEIASKGN